MGEVSLPAHPAPGGVVAGAGENPRGAAHAHDMDLERRAGGDDLAIEIGHGEALAHGMAIGAGGDEADPPLADPDRLEARGVRVPGPDLEGHQLLPWRPLVALAQRRLLAYEVPLPEIDEAIEPAHPRRIGPGEFPRPDAEALLHPERVEGVVAD